MPKFRKKPVVIEAMQFPKIGLTADAIDAVMDFEKWFTERGGKGRFVGDKMHVLTLEDGPNGVGTRCIVDVVELLASPGAANKTA